jgi:hypothetical protein
VTHSVYVQKEQKHPSTQIKHHINNMNIWQARWTVTHNKHQHALTQNRRVSTPLALSFLVSSYILLRILYSQLFVIHFKSCINWLQVMYFHQKPGIVYIYLKGNGKYSPKVKKLKHKAYQLHLTSDKVINVCNSNSITPTGHHCTYKDNFILFTFITLMKGINTHSEQLYWLPGPTL